MNDITTTEDEGYSPPAPLRSSVFDATRFKDVMAVAEVMAMSSLIPESLRFEMDPAVGDGETKRKAELGYEQVKANCFLICNWSAGVGMDPFAVAQGTSIVRGRLMFEGKIVHAALNSQLRVKLKPAYGKWDALKAATIVGAAADGEDMAIRVYEELPDGSMGRYIDGYVGGWKTTAKNNPWSLMINWRKQLMYRGSREWARVFEPGVMLGVLTPDEYDPAWDNARDITPARPQSTGSDVLGRLKEARSKEAAKTDGFDQQRIDETTKTGAPTAPAEEDKTVSNDESSPGDGEASSTSPAVSESSDEPAMKFGDVNNARATAMDWDWLRKIAAGLWSATNYKGDVSILKNQRVGLGGTYPSKDIPQGIRDKAKAVMDACVEVCEGKVKPAVARKLIAGITGMEVHDLAEK